MKKTSGLTLIELTVVLAIVAIIAAIVVPLFLLTTDRARLRGDISSAQIIQSALELYVLERGRTTPMSTHIESNDVGGILARLAGQGYINPRNVSIQTRSGDWEADWVRQGIPPLIMVDLTGAPTEILDAFASLPTDEQSFVAGAD
jgi:prepilin-type N-terminal cleavage/methylation domain-containing protein